MIEYEVVRIISSIAYIKHANRLVDHTKSLEQIPFCPRLFVIYDETLNNPIYYPHQIIVKHLKNIRIKVV